MLRDRGYARIKKLLLKTMILVRVPLRISFLGGGSDLPDVYRKICGRVLSVTIDKYIYIVINKPALHNTISVRYSRTETVEKPQDIEHPLFRTALLDFGIDKNIEIGSFASIPAKTGLGSSSSFAVGLAKGLSAYLGRKMSKEEAARAACRLEIDILQEPIGKQDQYAASYGGLNVIEFLPDESTTVKPVLVDYSKRLMFKSHLLLFFTGMMRSASEILSDQQTRISQNLERYKKMAGDVLLFQEYLFEGDMRGVGALLHEGWQDKKRLGGRVSNGQIDALYEAGLGAGAWGGKILGAGGGGCLLFVAPPDRHNALRAALADTARATGLDGFQEIPFRFTEGGAEIHFNQLQHMQ